MEHGSGSVSTRGTILLLREVLVRSLWAGVVLPREPQSEPIICCCGFSWNKDVSFHHIITTLACSRWLFLLFLFCSFCFSWIFSLFWPTEIQDVRKRGSASSSQMFYCSMLHDLWCLRQKVWPSSIWRHCTHHFCLCLASISIYSVKSLKVTECYQTQKFVSTCSCIWCWDII